MGRYLVVANVTMLGEHLREELRRRVEADGDASFRLLLPAQKDPGDGQALADSEHVKWPGEAKVVTAERRRLRAAVEALQGDGFTVDGDIADADPVRATVRATRTEDFDAVIVSTLPRTVSRWLKLDVPDRLSRKLDIPVVHVEAPDSVDA